MKSLMWALLVLLGCGFVVAVEAQSPVPIFVSGQDRDYVLLSPSKSTLITVKGPGELRLLSRPRFRPTSSEAQGYSLLVRVDGGAEQEVRYDKVERSRTAMFRDGTLGVPGRLQDYFLRLGRGYHNIEVRPATGSPQVFFRHLFKPSKERRRSWVPVTPRGAPELVELVVRETIVPYHRNAAGKPFSLEVIGPTELRIFTRLENTPEMRGRIHYRLQVRRNGQVVNTFQVSSRRSEVTTYRANDELVPGRAAEIAVPVPEGRHRFEIDPLDPNKRSLLARFMLPREDLSLTAE
ncbi:MAG: hypothetical protein AAF604_11420 [Acidobacteriota bacterium]